MLQNIRDKLQGHRWLSYVVLGALAVVFTAWGAYGLVDLSLGPPAYAAKVNGQEVAVADVQRVWQEQQPQYIRLFGGDIPEERRKQLQEPVARLVRAQCRATATRAGCGHPRERRADHPGLPQRARLPDRRQVLARDRACAPRAGGSERSVIRGRPAALPRREPAAAGRGRQRVPHAARDGTAVRARERAARGALRGAVPRTSSRARARSPTPRSRLITRSTPPSCRPRRR